MKVLALLFGAVMLTGCSSVASDYAGYVWEHRDEFIYENDSFDADRKENEVYNLGAALEKDPAELEADIAEYMAADDEEDEDDAE